MLISEAKTWVGRVVKLSWLDRRGDEMCRDAEVYDVGFVPLYGPCFITDHGDIRLDRVTACVDGLAQAA